MNGHPSTHTLGLPIRRWGAGKTLAPECSWAAFKVGYVDSMSHWLWASSDEIGVDSDNDEE